MPDLPPHAPPSLAFLAGQVAAIWCQCERCWRIATVPLAKLIERFGGAVPFLAIRHRFRCAACGSRQVHVRPDWPSSATLDRLTGA